MLHNSGGYNPNDSPHNANTPVNMSQSNAPVNMGRSLPNIGEMPQPSLRGPSGHYNLPNYPTYHHPTLDMRSNLDNFSKGFHQHYRMSPSPHTALSSWQNGIAPLNLNAQSTYVPNSHNFHTSYDKFLPNNPNVPVEPKDVKVSEEKAIVTPESSLKSHNDSNYFYNTHPNTIPSQDMFSNYNHTYPQNVNRERTPMDVTKRRSLENTVKLIENILINTSKEQRNINTNQTYDNTLQMGVDECKERDIDTTLDKEYKTFKSNDKIESSNNETSESNENMEDIKEILIETDFKVNNMTTDEINNDLNTQDEIKQTTKDAIKDIKVKIEVDISAVNEEEEYNLEFCKDINGISREEMDENISISQNSISDAIDAAKQGTKTECCYECQYCKLLFIECKRFLIHNKWHTFGLTNEKRLSMAREREMQKKQRKEAKIVDQLHKAIEEEGGSYNCKDCTKIFTSKGSLKNHRTRFHSGRIRECGICGAVAMGWAGLKAHAATHVSPYKCTVCDKVFRHKHSLQRHAETHMEEEEKTLPCTQCGKLFAVASRLKEHMRVHTRAERGAVYQCTYCAKSFFQSYSLVIHERTHRNEKPYACDICNSSYGTNSSLKRHMKVSHNQSKPFVCSQCLRCFISARALHSHIVRVHADGTDPLYKKRRRRPKDSPKQAKKEPKSKNTKNATEEAPEMAEIEQVVN